jgi:hypothetical protein
MTLTFRYRAVERPDGRVVKSPSIPVTLVGKAARYDVIGLLDSGADVSVIPKDMAELLGLDLERKPVEESRGIGGTVRSVSTVLQLIVEAKRGHERYQITLPVNVLLDGESPPLLLGRAGFFELFVITFDEDGQRISLKRVTRSRA